MSGGCRLLKCITAPHSGASKKTKQVGVPWALMFAAGGVGCVQPGLCSLANAAASGKLLVRCVPGVQVTTTAWKGEHLINSVKVGVPVWGWSQLDLC